MLSPSLAPNLPPELYVFERGWLSANNLLFIGHEQTALVDTGYCSHADQTLALVESALNGRPLDWVLNTHLHSDHCGGNARLQAHYPGLRTAIPPGQAAQVRDWDPVALSYTPTGQDCPRFTFDAVLEPGSRWRLGDRDWEVHAAPGHDTHSIVLWEPEYQVLISADALWENGFGVVFPELDGEDAFEAVADTLDLIERLQPRTVLPGHGRMFTDLPAALATARRRLDGFVRDPRKHALYASKVLLKYKLLEWQRIGLDELHRWLAATPYMTDVHARYFDTQDRQAWQDSLVQDLLRSGAARVQDDALLNA